MSNPGINRWGVNLFWYSFWYSDKNSYLTNHQDNLLNKLIFLYLHYGILLTKPLFANFYWYQNFNINFNFIQNNFNLKYFRLIEYKNKIINEYKAYKIRTKIKNIYFSKIWILRYQNWLIINFYCFQPLNIKKNKKIIKKKNFSFYVNNKRNDKYLIYRYKFFLFYFLNNFLNKSYYFKF